MSEQDLLKTDIAGYLARQAEKDTLRFITCGSVDDGKSTLIGRLLYESKLIFDDQLAALDADSRKFGTQGDAFDDAEVEAMMEAAVEPGSNGRIYYEDFAAILASDGR